MPHPQDLLPETADARLRDALGRAGHRYTEQRAAVYRYLGSTTTHPTADEVFHAVRRSIPGISLATVYKSLETLVNCGMAAKLAYSDGSGRYDAHTDPHPHARCLHCGRVIDVPGAIPPYTIEALERGLHGFSVVGYRLELIGRCSQCNSPLGASGPVDRRNHRHGRE